MTIKGFNKNKGVTLIELLIVLSLLSIIIRVLFSIFMFGNVTFSRGESQYNLQSEARMVIESVTGDLRFVKKLKIIDAYDPSLVTPYETILYFDIVDNSIIKAFGGTTVKYRFHTEATNPFEFKKSSSKKLKYSLNGRNDRQNFSLSSNILLLNVDDINIDALSSTTGSAVVFLTPEAFVAQSRAPTIKLPSPNVNTLSEISIVYNQPTTAYRSTLKVQPVIKPTNPHPLEISDISVSIIPMGIDSMLKVTLDLVGVVLEDGDRIKVDIDSITEVDSLNQPVVQYYFQLIYNYAENRWDVL